MDNSSRKLLPKSLDQLGKSEEFLESLIANNPGLLQLENRRSGIVAPFKLFRQLALPTPNGRVIYPDVVLLAASGHVVVVEVKLGCNPELRNRAVIAQIVDYAASFSSIGDKDLPKVFSKNISMDSWDQLVQSWFPKQNDIEDLATVLQHRMQSGEINLVIACDRVPIGLPDIVSGVSSNSALGFELDLVEITPYVSANSEELIFVPSTRLKTEIVARTAVDINYRSIDQKPEVQVVSTSAKSIVENVNASNESRRWNVEEVESAVLESGNSLDKMLFEFAKRHSWNGECVSPQLKKMPTFGFTCAITQDGKPTSKMLFWCIIGWNLLTFNMFHLKKYSDKIESEFKSRISKLLGENVDLESSTPNIRYEYLEPVAEEFLRECLWVKEQVSQKN